MKPASILRRLPRLAAATLASLAIAILCLPALAADGHPLPLWRVSDGHGHSLYLAGSMHALTRADYPLPRPFTRAFRHSQRLVEELDLERISPEEIGKAIRSTARLPGDDTLADAMGTDWPEARKLAGEAGVELAAYRRDKPWFAAIRIAAQRFVKAGYKPRLGLDRHFANLAAEDKMPIVGLETFVGQMQLLDAIEPALQRRFLLQTLEQVSSVEAELARLHKAWRSGNTAALGAIARKDFADYPKLRKRLLDARNRHWMPTLERCLERNQGCFVVVGTEHMVGPAGLLALLRNAGYRIAQLHGSRPRGPATTRG